MTQLKITTVVSIVLVAALATSHAAQAQRTKSQDAGANTSRAQTSDHQRPDDRKPNHGKPAHDKPQHKPRFEWKNLWNKQTAKEITIAGIDGTCRTTASATLEATEKGVANTGAEMQRLSCRLSLTEPGTPYQVSVLMDHGASEKFDCAAGPLRASRRYERRTQTQDSISNEELEESPGVDRDEWQFLSSRRLNTISVRCRIPAGGIVSEVTLTDCSVDKCSTADES